ncbi:uncharacterized protein METZ01_LOCUS191169, partial [marine metagenome]
VDSAGLDNIVVRAQFRDQAVTHALVHRDCRKCRLAFSFPHLPVLGDVHTMGCQQGSNLSDHARHIFVTKHNQATFWLHAYLVAIHFHDARMQLIS